MSVPGAMSVPGGGMPPPSLQQQSPPPMGMMAGGMGASPSAPGAPIASVHIADVGTHWDEHYIASLFASFPGFKQVKLMTRNGYGFADFDHPEAAAAALTAMNGQVVPAYGVPLRLTWASRNTMPAPGGVSSAPPARGASSFTPEHSVFIAGFGADVTEDALRQLFASRFPDLVNLKVVYDSATGASKCYGFARFASPADVPRAIADFHGMQFGMFKLRVSEVQGKSGGGGGGGGGMPAAAPHMAHMPLTPAHGMSPYGGAYGMYGGGAYGAPSPYAGMGYAGMGYGMPPAAPAAPGYGAPAMPSPYMVPGHTLDASGRPMYAPVPPPEEGQTTLFLGNVDPSLSEADIFLAFQTTGPVAHTKVLREKQCAFVQFQYRASAETALKELQGLQLGSTRLRLEWGRNVRTEATAGGAHHALGMAAPMMPTHASAAHMYGLPPGGAQPVMSMPPPSMMMPGSMMSHYPGASMMPGMHGMPPTPAGAPAMARAAGASEWAVHPDHASAYAATRSRMAGAFDDSGDSTLPSNLSARNSAWAAASLAGMPLAAFSPATPASLHSSSLSV